MVVENYSSNILELRSSWITLQVSRKYLPIQFQCGNGRNELVIGKLAPEQFFEFNCSNFAAADAV